MKKNKSINEKNIIYFFNFASNYLICIFFTIKNKCLFVDKIDLKKLISQIKVIL